MTVFASQLNRHWSDGTAFDIEPERRALTLRIIVRALFGVESPDTAQHMAGPSRYATSACTLA